MSRPLRVVEPGLWHHVMNRGQGGRVLFRDEEDRESFFEILGQVSNRWSVWVTALCLMDNHYHLVLLDEHGCLSRAMGHIDGVFTQRYNRKYGTDGSLMRGRFKSRVVQQEKYLAELFRYVHANPVRAGVVARAEDYRWSSHRWYLRGDGPSWLRTDLVLAELGDVGDRIGWLDDFVHERVEPDIERQLASERWAPIFGDVAFRERLRTRVREDRRLARDGIPQGRRLAALTIKEVLRTARDVFDVDQKRLVEGQRGVRNVPRLLTMLTCREHTMTSAQELSKIFGVRPGTVSVLAMKARKLVRDERSVRRAWSKLQKALSTGSEK